MTASGAKNVGNGQIRVAALVAAALLIGSGVGYRAAESRVPDWVGIDQFPPGTLSQLQPRIGDWSGRDAPLDERVIEIVDADDHLSRVYARGGRETVTLFIALRRRDVAFAVAARELMPHRPEVCYPAHGWNLDEKRAVELEAADGSSLPVAILAFQRGELEVERVTVLTYYVVDGRRHHDLAELRSTGWRPKGDIRYVAQVEIAGLGSVYRVPVEVSIQAFAADSAPDILALITDAIGSPRPQRALERSSNPPGTDAFPDGERG